MPDPVAYSEHLDLQDSWRSIYIPVVPTDLLIGGQEVDLVKFFEQALNVGRISRIDFVNRKLESTDKEIRSAYVHFDFWCDNHVATNLRRVIDYYGEYKCKGFYDGFVFNHFDNNRFMAFKVNHKPIPEADGSLNVHQLNAIKVGLEKENTELRAKVDDMEAELSRRQALPIVEEGEEVENM